MGAMASSQDMEGTEPMDVQTEVSQLVYPLYLICVFARCMNLLCFLMC